MIRHLPDVPVWREAAARAWSAAFRPRRLSFGGKLAIVTLVLFGVGLSAYTRHYVDQRVQIRIAQNCASWGADQTLFDLTLELTSRPLRDPTPEAVQRAGDFRRSLIQSRDTKVELRRQNQCPPYPPPPTVPPVPSSSP